MSRRPILSLFLLIVAAFVLYQVIDRYQNTEEIRQIIHRSNIIYACDKRGAEFVVTKIPKHEDQGKFAENIRVGQSVILNRQRLKMDIRNEGLQVVVFAEPGTMQISGLNLPRQSEIPLLDGRLIPYPVTFKKLREMIAQDRTEGDRNP